MPFEDMYRGSPTPPWASSNIGETPITWAKRMGAHDVNSSAYSKAALT